MFLVLGTICPTTCRHMSMYLGTVRHGRYIMAAHSIVVARWWGFILLRLLPAAAPAEPPSAA
jgi:hypothetical protein